jgi:hypothetical protein
MPPYRHHDPHALVPQIEAFVIRWFGGWAFILSQNFALMSHRYGSERRASRGVLPVQRLNAFVNAPAS